MTLPGISLPNDRYRRVAGFVLGSLVGLTYVIVYQYGDRLAIPGAPLYQPPFGLAGNLVMFTLGAGLLGLLTAWPRSGLSGTFVTAGLIAGAVIVFAFADAGTRSRDNLAASVVAGLFLTLPFWGLLVPILGALRWVVGHEEEGKRDHQPWHRRILQPLVLLLVVALAGLTLLYPQDARVLIAKTNQMLQAGQAGETLPEPLAGTSFDERGIGAFQLSWERDRIERFMIPRPARNFDQHSVVVARFDNGWNLVCLYISLTDPPLCHDMEVIPR